MLAENRSKKRRPFIALGACWSYTAPFTNTCDKYEGDMIDELSLRVRYFHFAGPGCRPTHREKSPLQSPKFWGFVNCERSVVRKRRAFVSAQAHGFTLMELLIAISIILILMLMAMPAVGGMKKHANETSAVNSVQTIATAEIMYASSYPAKGFTCSLAALGGDPTSGPPTPTAAQLIQPDLASGYKSGYTFNITNCAKTSGSGSDYVKGYMVTAVPETVGRTGDRGFCIDQNGGSPKYDPAGGTDCRQLLQQ
jgi:type IV pilus assembly protein PilA